MRILEFEIMGGGLAWRLTFKLRCADNVHLANGCDFEIVTLDPSIRKEHSPVRIQRPFVTDRSDGTTTIHAVMGEMMTHIDLKFLRKHLGSHPDVFDLVVEDPYQQPKIVW